MSLRLRLTLFIALVVATAVAAVSWISYTSTADEAREEIDVFLLGNRDCAKDELTSEVWVTAYPTPYVSKTVTLGAEN